MDGITTLKREVKTVLVVDDEADIRDAYAEALGDLGCRVLLKPDGPSALASVKQGADIDLVITDYMMPDMNGLNFVKLLRTIRPSVPIIMITGFMSLENYLQSRKLGVFEYVDKPVRIDEFRRVVAAAFEPRESPPQESNCL